jgi:hypothetical protein
LIWRLFVEGMDEFWFWGCSMGKGVNIQNSNWSIVQICQNPGIYPTKSMFEGIVFVAAVKLKSSVQCFNFCGGNVFSFVVWDCSSKGIMSQVLCLILLNHIQVMKSGRWIR